MDALSIQSQIFFTDLLKKAEQSFNEKSFYSIVKPVYEAVKNKTLLLNDVVQPIFHRILTDLTFAYPLFQKIFSIKVLSQNQEDSFVINGLFWSRISGFIRSNYANELERMLQLNEELFCSMTCLESYYDLLFELDSYFKTGLFNFKKFSKEESEATFKTLLSDLQMDEAVFEKFFPSRFLKLNHRSKTFTIVEGYSYYSFPLAYEVKKIPSFSLKLDESYFNQAKEKMSQIATSIRELGIRVSLVIDRFSDSYFEYFYLFKGIQFKKIKIKICYKHLTLFFNRIKSFSIESLHLHLTDPVSAKIVDTLEARGKALKKIKITFNRQEESFKARVCRLSHMTGVEILGLTEISYSKITKFSLEHLKIYQNDHIPTDTELDGYFFYSGLRKTYSLSYSHEKLDFKKRAVTARILKLFDDYAIRVKIQNTRRVLIISNRAPEIAAQDKTVSLMQLLRGVCKEIMAERGQKKAVDADELDSVRLIYSKAFKYCFQEKKLELLKETINQFPDIFDCFTKFTFKGVGSNFQLNVHKQIWRGKGYFLIAECSILPKEVSFRSLQWLDNAFAKNIDVEEITNFELKDEVLKTLRIINESMGDYYQPF